MTMQSNLNRPLEYKDFKNPSKNEIGISMILKYWGSLNKMKKELELEIIQESMMDKQLSKKDFDKIINKLIKFLSYENRNFITTREINENTDFPQYNTLDKICKKYYNVKLVKYLNNFGIFFGCQGRGLNYNFDDGEHISSYYEYMFSKFLKENGFIYNYNYFRDVKYSTFIKSYNGNMNCDYVIYTENEIIYIEIAGIIADYKTWYYKNKTISQSNSKEKYKIKLKEKEEMLKKDNLIYFILFPCDLTIENFQNIIYNQNLLLRHNIEKFYKSNIDWKKVRKIGKLDYSQDIIKNTKSQKEVI